jgi:hypothetical protein
VVFASKNVERRTLQQLNVATQPISIAFYKFYQHQTIVFTAEQN